jgi:Phage tail sheath protein subtilisin-like domain/Phage tail sheath C-terminal domain
MKERAMAIQVSPGVNVAEIDLTTVVPNVQTTTGAIAGMFNWGPVNLRKLVDSEATLAATFGKPNDTNFETFFTAANFLAYGNSLQVVRVIDGANNAVANTGVITAFAIKNSDDYANSTIAANAAYVAKYPGSLGNSLKISVCDSPNAYIQTVNAALIQTVSSNAYGNVSYISISANSGSNTATITYVANQAGQANAAAQATTTWFTVGDLIDIGNTATGVQTVKITAVTPSNAETGTGANIQSYATLSLASALVLPANVANQTSTTSYWEFYSQVDKAPGTSNYMVQKGYTAKDELHVVVVDQLGSFTGTPGTILEVFKGLSRATDAKTDNGSSNYYKTVLNNTSNYVWFGNDRAGAVSNTANSVVSSTNQSPYTATFVLGGDGNSEANCSLSAITAGYDFFKNKEDVDISLVLAGKARGLSVESTTPSSPSQNYNAMANYIVSNIAEYRKDCVAFISPAKADAVVQTSAGDATTNVINFLNNMIIASSYAVMDSGYKYQYDKYNDTYRWVPLNGDVAGTCVRTDNTRDPWFSPAGFQRGQIKNVTKLAYNPNQTQRDALYKAGINPVVTFTGQGTILYGDKTLLGRPSAFDRINVRRLFITVEKAIAIAAKSNLFEFNDDFTRTQFVNLIEPYLRDVQGRRGITDFRVVCDTTNNTAQIINSNQFVGDIYIKPNYSINFIQLNFVAVRSGVEFSTIVGSV